METRPGTDETVQAFFERYAAALLSRDEKAMADLYAVPCLILFPGQTVLVTEAAQTEAFFASAWGQYEGIDAVEKQTNVLAEAPGSIWADVTWSYGGRPQERFCYQLIETARGWQVAVLTPLA